MLNPKRAVRLIANSKTMSHSDPIFLKYNILKINDQITVNDLNCVPKCEVFPALYTSLFPQASSVLGN